MKVVPDWVWDLLCKAKQRLRERLPTIEFYCAYYGTLRAIFFAEDLPKLKDLPQLRIIEPFKAAHVVSNLYYDPEFDILFLIKETNVPHLYEFVPDNYTGFPFELLEDDPYKQALLDILNS